MDAFNLLCEEHTTTPTLEPPPIAVSDWLAWRLAGRSVPLIDIYHEATLLGFPAADVARATRDATRCSTTTTDLFAEAHPSLNEERHDEPERH